MVRKLQEVHHQVRFGLMSHEFSSKLILTFGNFFLFKVVVVTISNWPLCFILVFLDSLNGRDL